MNGFNRSDRVAQQIHREVSTIIDNELRDLRLGMVTVTDVVLSKDLRNARIFVSVLGGDAEIKQSLSILKSASKYIRGLLGQRMVLKYLPEITFSYDSSTVDGMRMDKILEDLSKKDE